MQPSDVRGDSDGDLDVRGDFDGDLDIRGGSDGHLHVRGDSNGDMDIRGDFGGDLDIRGDSDGNLDVRGDFDRHSDIGGKTKSLPVGQTLERTSSQPPYFVYGSAYLKVVSAHFIYSPIQWIHCGPVEILLAQLRPTLPCSL
ncbi:hypothetical protein AB205_0168710 [Aquarana catesbeiana]|uniref:Uncharacterized protein n=1 Tax=Aquarana catesbeiana TaxID=8400 RepID=A0A2G9NL33_AQUCT|nr:hypothetical protein AB205_0168710 [Aquarana catesbeiana]